MTTARREAAEGYCSTISLHRENLVDAGAAFFLSVSRERHRVIYAASVARRVYSYGRRLHRPVIQPGLFGEAPIFCHATAVTTAFDVEMIGVFGDGPVRGT
jgi:hypothetical protein